MMKGTLIKGTQFHVTRRRWGCSSASGILITITILYVFFFAKYAYFQVEFHQNDLLVDSPIDIGNTHRCPKYPDTLKGITKMDLNTEPPSMRELIAQLPSVKPGGTWQPDHCQSTQKVAIIIPYRARWPHLRQLLQYLHPFLQRQQRHYRIYVVEQAYDDVFNKGRIMNIAFNEALKDENWNCFIFHDVDMIPQNDLNIYECGHNPRHLSPALDELRFNLMYPSLVGGVLALSHEQVEQVNGFSNLYWGWGTEDDDMSKRITAAEYHILRPPNRIGRYKMIRHSKREIGRFRLQLFLDWERWSTEGINSLHTLKYEILGRTNDALYTNITVDIGPMPEIPEGQKPPSLFQSFLAVLFFLFNV